jgi:hypothetical protein
MSFLSLVERKTTRLLIPIALAIFTLATLQAVPIFATSSAACTPDFTMNVVPSSLTVINGGPGVNIGVGFTSVCGLSGTINFGVHGITPKAFEICTKQGVCTSNGLVFKQCCYDLPIKAGGSTGNHITVSATPSTLDTTFQIMITGTNIQGGCCYGITHSMNVTVTVKSCCFPSLSIGASPTSVSAPLGQPVKSAITLTGSGGFSGTVYYTISISPFTVFGSNSCFNPVPGGPILSPSVTSVISQWSCTITPKGTYTVSITATPLNGPPDPAVTIIVKVT